MNVYSDFRVGQQVRAIGGHATGEVLAIHPEHGVKVAWEVGPSLWMLPDHIEAV